jgi:hypothetical protein
VGMGPDSVEPHIIREHRTHSGDGSKMLRMKQEMHGSNLPVRKITSVVGSNWQ